MAYLSENQKTSIRYLIALNMSVIFGFLTAGMINDQVSYFFGYLPLPVFIGTTMLALTITAFYSSLFGQISFNVWSIVIGWLTGAASALVMGRVEVVPYSIFWPLVFNTVVTTVLTFFIKPKPFAGLPSLLVTIHVLSIVIVFWGTIYSLWHRWIWPWGIVFAIDSFALWSPAIVGKCPVTILEGQVRTAQGQQTKLGEEERFVPHYLKKWFGIRISERTSKNAPRVIAVVMFSWWIVEYIIH